MNDEKTKSATDTPVTTTRQDFLEEPAPVEQNILSNTILFNKTASASLSNVYGLNRALLQNVDTLTWRNTDLLKKFLSPGGKILSYRFTGLSRKKQNKLKKIVKIARILAVL